MKLATIVLYHIKSGSYTSLLDEEGKHQSEGFAITPFWYTSFQYLLYSGYDQTMINATIFDHRDFAILLSEFKPYYDCYTFHDGTGFVRAATEIRK